MRWRRRRIPLLVHSLKNLLVRMSGETGDHPPPPPPPPPFPPSFLEGSNRNWFGSRIRVYRRVCAAWVVLARVAWKQPLATPAPLRSQNPPPSSSSSFPSLAMTFCSDA